MSTDGTTMSVSASVIVASRDRASLLARTLDSLLAQTPPAGGYEIVVADNGSVDDTKLVVEQAAARSVVAVRYMLVDRPGKSFAVNQALAAAAGRVLAFTDDDVVAERDWLVVLTRACLAPGVAFVAGRVLPAWETPPPAWMSPALHGVLAVPDNGDEPFTITAREPRLVPIGANMAVRRDVVKKVGGLRVDLGKLAGSFRTGEDHEFFLRMLHAGFTGVYEPKAVVHHRVPRQRLERDYFRRWLFQNGHDVAKLRRSYPMDVRGVLGVPRYLWRQAASDVLTVIGATIRRDEAARFAAAVRLTWLRGYARESWFHPTGLTQ